MTKAAIIDEILEAGMIIILRMSTPDQIIPVVDALHQGGINIVEITSNTPEWTSKIGEVKDKFPKMLVGAGTITNQALAIEAIENGAQFLITPNLNEDVILTANKHHIPIASGAFSPTEMHNAVLMGADMIKLFPADHAGPEFMKAVKATLPDIPIIPTGGINFSNLQTWINHGAKAFGIGGSIVNKGFIRENRYDLVTQHAIDFKAALEEARQKYQQP